MRSVDVLLLCASVSLGCAGPTLAPTRSPIQVHRARATRPVARCEIPGREATAVRVAVPGREPLVVNVRGGSLRLSPGSDPTVARVNVTAPLRFRGTVDPAAQALTLREGGSFAAGALELAPAAPLLTIERREGAIEAWVQLGQRDVGSRRGLELSAGPVRVECSELSLERHASRSAPPRPVPGAPLRVVDGALTLRPVRIAPRSVTLRPRIGEIVAAQVLDRHGAWTRLETRFADGGRAVGWSSSTALRDPTAAEAERLERLFAEPQVTQRELSLPDVATPAPVDANEYVGRARMNANAPVFAAPGESVWARGPNHPIEVTVRQASGAQFTELLGIPGLEVDRPVWVRSAALRLQR